MTMRTSLTTALLLCFSLLSFAQSTTICWDASLSMQNRDLNKDFEYLDSYFAAHPNEQVSLLIFNTGVTSQEAFTVTSGDWSTLKERLSQVRYDGATSFQGLSTKIDSGTILLFTDGQQTISRNNPVLNGTVFIINSNDAHAAEKLQLLAAVNKGTFVNLAANSEEKQYTGRVIAKDNVIPKVKISVRGKATATTSNNEGAYSIQAKPGDVLVFEAAGKNSVTRKVGADDTIDIFMEADGIRLGEVLIETRKEQILEPELTMTAMGEVNRDAIGYSVESIGDERISEITTTVSQAVQGKFNSVEYGSGQDLSQAVIRGMNSFQGNNYALIVIDGVALRQSDSSGNSNPNMSISDFIDPNTIGDITVLKGLAAANRWGSAGKNGVILITTKLALANAEAERQGKQVKNTALLQNNIYEGKINNTKRNFTTPYLKELQKDKAVEDAYNTYIEQRANYNDAPEYYIDVANFFRSTNQALAAQIQSNILENDNSSITALKALLFHAHQQNNLPLELETANRILEMYPNQIQSYLDVALAHKTAGNYQVAVDMLHKMSTGSINTDLDFSPLMKIIDNELKNLIAKHKAVINTDKIGVKHIKPVTYEARLTFAWNNVDAEFDLQFVNPQKRFFNWEHTTSQNAERLQSEKMHGYTKEEFLLVGAEKGEWLVNAIYKGDTSRKDQPTFLTCTVEYDFGKPNQRTEEFLIRLHDSGSEENLARILLK